jgi:hypothetical protein
MANSPTVLLCHLQTLKQQPRKFLSIIAFLPRGRQFFLAPNENHAHSGLAFSSATTTLCQEVVMYTAFSYLIQRNKNGKRHCIQTTTIIQHKTKLTPDFVRRPSITNVESTHIGKLQFLNVERNALRKENIYS